MKCFVRTALEQERRRERFYHGVPIDFDRLLEKAIFI